MSRVLKTNAYDRTPLHILREELFNRDRGFVLPEGRSMLGWTNIDSKVMATTRGLNRVLKMRI